MTLPARICSAVAKLVNAAPSSSGGNFKAAINNIRRLVVAAELLPSTARTGADGANFRLAGVVDVRAETGIEDGAIARVAGGESSGSAGLPGTRREAAEPLRRRP